MVALLLYAQLTVQPSALANLYEVPLKQVKIEDRFWAPRQEINRKVSLAHSLDMIEKFGYLENFERAAQGKTGGYHGPVFMDSDVYKVLEACSLSLTTHPDSTLEKRLDAIIAKMAAAQQPDGYLDTYFLVAEPGKRWTNLRDCHELYCAGHLFEAASAHFSATGKRNLLDIATRYADYIDSVFGEAPGKRQGYCGHPEIELALVKLWKVTGNGKYFDLASFFIRHRGEHFFAREHRTPEAEYDGTYFLDDVPITDHKKIKGHAVRAAYLMSGVTDVAGATHDEALLRMLDRVWRNTNERNTYVTGGIGPSASNEGFTTDFDLPNLTAYQETCASVALAMWNHRMNLVHGDAKYADAMERSLYNGVISGVSLSGDKFFYVNPLASMGNHHRSEWFSCACCPPNETRTTAAIGQYAYATGPESLYVNLYIQGIAQASIGKQSVHWEVASQYPWDGKVFITFKSPFKGSLHLRIPSWSPNFGVRVNQSKVELPTLDKGYLVLERSWNSGDKVELDLDMAIRRIAADPRVKADQGQCAIARGPIVYCLEEVDNPGSLTDLWLPVDAKLTAKWSPDLLGGVMTVQGMGRVGHVDWPGGLYQTVNPTMSAPLFAIPYYAWDNRKPGAMKVWVAFTPPAPPSGGPERSAKVTLSFVSNNCQPSGINDGIEPTSSGEVPAANCHWWPHKGGTEWAQYSWSKPQEITGTRVFWFDDTGRGECRLPKSWRILYKRGDEWLPVKLTASNYSILLDRWNLIHFEPVVTTDLRLEMQMQDGWAAGVLEWKLETAE